MSWIELVAQRHPPTAPQGVSPPENAKDWFRVENNADDADTTDVLIYSSIGGWFGMWADELVDELKQVTTSKINLRLNSPGGSVFDGIAIANAIRSHPATVTVYVDSLAASIASVIAMSGDRLVMMPQSQIMVHNASGSCYGDATEMTKMADLLDKQSRNIAEAYAQHTGGSLAEWTQYMADETWFSADEALAVGLADEVVPMRKTTKEATPADAKLQASWDLSMYRYAGRDAAPDPVAKKSLVNIELDGEGLTEQVLEPMRRAIAASGLKPGQRITAEALAALPAGEVVVPAKLVAELSTDELLKLITDTVRSEIVNADPPWLKPKKGDDEEEEEEDDEEKESDNASDDEPTDSAPREPLRPGRLDGPVVVPIPADGLKAGECSPPIEHPTDTGLGPDTVESTETHDEADDWNSVVGLLHVPTSPSADDVFAQLKEGW